MSINRLLLTGATGFIGRHVMPLLASKGYEVHGMHFGDAAPKAPAGCEYHEANVLDTAAQERLLAELKPEYLLHLAWEARPGIYWTSLANLEWMCASVNLFRSFYKQGGRRGVAAGTCAEYHWAGNTVYKENTPSLPPLTLYGACKAAFTQIVDTYARQENLSFTWGRLFFPFGPGEYPQRLVPTVICSLLRNEPAKTTDGRHVRDFIHVEDAARAFFSLLESNCRGPVNIGSGSGVALADVITKLGALIGRPELIQLGTLPTPANEPVSIVADISRLKNEVGFSPVFSFDEALKQTIEWWKTHL